MTLWAVLVTMADGTQDVYGPYRSQEKAEEKAGDFMVQWECDTMALPMQKDN